MSNYDDKLAEWLKYVADSAAQDKSESDTAQQEQQKPAAQPEQTRQQDMTDRYVMRDRLGRVIPDNVSDVDPTSTIADLRMVDRQRDVSNQGAGVFEDTDVPDVEDYLPFLKEPEQKKIDLPPVSRKEPQIQVDRVIEKPQESLSVQPLDQTANDPMLPFTEGTGEPKLIVRMPKPPVEPQADVQPVQPEPMNVLEQQPKPKELQVAAPKQVNPPAQMDAANVQELWSKLPKHIQLLMGQSQQEVAQHSYKKFKETREELIARLLDPTLSLEETARILNVCPTTVRRYTNRGALKHLRTAGNQRRFLLSDVLAFLETQQIYKAESMTDNAG